MIRFRFPPPTLTLLLATLFALHAPLAHAWGGQGHRLVARVAETELTPQAKKQIDTLLAGEPNPTLAGIASWADELREHDPDLGKKSSRWHYVNLGEHDCAYDPPVDCPDGNCVIEALQKQITLLADRHQPLEARRQALKFVVHFVGDIHQPMHAGYANDKGGNDFQLQFNGKGTNLHSLWDSGMLYDRHLSDDDYLAQLLQLPATPATTPVLPPDAVAWAQASCRVAIAPGVYPAKHVLPEGYVAQYRPMAEAALRQAGDRLAAILNAALDTP